MAPPDITTHARVSLEGALRDLGRMRAGDATAPEWRWQLRRSLSDVREALASPALAYGDVWLAPREQVSHRSRRRLLTRVSVLAAGVLDRLDAESILVELARLQTDLEHHLQRLHDLVYDSVSVELGGSE